MQNPVLAVLLDFVEFTQFSTVTMWICITDLLSLENCLSVVFGQVIVADNFFTGSKDNLKKWIGHPRFELIRHGNTAC